MIIDISKWVVIFLVLFFAFACSLFLIFSYYSVALDQYNTIVPPSPNGSFYDVPQLPLLTIQNVSISQAKCPEIFYGILNETKPSPTMNWNVDGYVDDDKTALCALEDNFDIIKQVGHYPAIHYFGESFSATILTIFFTLFGVIGENNVADRGYELITLTCYVPDPATYAAGFDLFSSNIGFVLYGLFAFICGTVLINTLIAMMEESFDTIDDRADIEWKFSRSRLYMEYIRDGNTLPIPMNIFPSPKSLVYFVQRIKRMLVNISSKPPSTDSFEQAKNANRDNYDGLDGLNLPRRRGGETNQTSNFKNKKIFVDRKRSYILNEKLTYKTVIERIVKRFLLYYKNKNSATDDTNEGNEFKEFKNDISSFRFEMLSEIDLLDEMRVSIVQSMRTLNDDLRERFDFDQIERYLNNQSI